MYQIYKMGQITKFEAGVIYRAVKEEKINAVPEFTKDLYDQTNDGLYLATSRYQQDAISYDRIYNAVDSILNGDYDSAQQEIDKYIDDAIDLAGKKSIYFKYKNI